MPITPTGRSQRAARARREGNAKAAALKPPATKVVIPETAAAQVARVLASTLAAEARAGQGHQGELFKPATAKPGPVNGKPAKAKPANHPAPEPAQLFDLDAAISQLRPEYVQCRDFGHSWRPFTARWITSGNYYEQIFRCGRCETERFRYLGSRGQILSSKYDYADGYQMIGAGYLSSGDRDHIRLASIRQFEVKDSVQE